MRKSIILVIVCTTLACSINSTIEKEPENMAANSSLNSSQLPDDGDIYFINIPDYKFYLKYNELFIYITIFIVMKKIII